MNRSLTATLDKRPPQSTDDWMKQPQAPRVNQRSLRLRDSEIEDESHGPLSYRWPKIHPRARNMARPRRALNTRHALFSLPPLQLRGGNGQVESQLERNYRRAGSTYICRHRASSHAMLICHLWHAQWRCLSLLPWCWQTQFSHRSGCEGRVCRM